MAKTLLVVVYCHVDNDDMIQLISAFEKQPKRGKTIYKLNTISQMLQRARQISHLNRLREQQHLLDKDVSDYCNKMMIKKTNIK